MDFEKLEELYNKGRAALDIGRLDEAEELFNQILAEDPNNENVLNKMGVVYIYREDRSKAREFFEKALEVNSDHAPTLTNLGSIELEEGNMNKAEMLYRQALRFNPDYGPAHNNLAHILKRTGRVSEAVKHMRKAQRSGTTALQIKNSNKKDIGCFVIIVLGIIALLLWFLTN